MKMSNEEVKKWNQLRELMNQAFKEGGWTYSKLGKCAGMDPGALHRFMKQSMKKENEFRTLKFQNLAPILKALGMDVNQAYEIYGAPIHQLSKHNPDETQELTALQDSEPHIDEFYEYKKLLKSTNLTLHQIRIIVETHLSVNKLIQH